jgi:DNA repair exonuclease SbcCD ATPase subunit
MEEKKDLFEETVKNLQELEERISKIAEIENGFDEKLESFDERIQGAFDVQKNLDQQIQRMGAALDKLQDTLKKASQLQQSLERLLDRYEKLDLDHLAESIESASDATHKDYERITLATSEEKKNGEYIDKWLKFKPANFLDVDTRYGEITALKLFKDKMIFW